MVDTPRVRLMVVRNDPSDPPALLVDWWSEADVELVLVNADEGDVVPSSLPADIDGLVLLGGGMAAWEDHIAPWLPAERALVAACVSDGTPVLGVCLGAQIMTIACGGTVERADQPEVGIVELNLLPTAAEDPLFSALPQGVPVGQFHQDAMTVVPAGAVVLANTPACEHQAYRLGDHAWAVQFHPEIDAAIMDSWAIEDPDTASRCGLGPGEAAAGIAARADELMAAWRPFAHAFADVVRATVSR
ncbi:MAG: type 1 glutamine amidotransferase [Actinomycetes bacterium]